MKGLVVLLLTLAAAYAQVSAVPSAIQSFDWIVGVWQCEGRTPAGKIDYTFSQQIERPAASHWFRFHGVSKGEIDPALASDTSFETFDPGARLWRYFSFYDSGAYSVGTAADFVNNRQTWTGYTYENGVRKPWGRIVFIKISEREKREEFYQPQANRKERFVGSEICTKAAQ